MYWPWQPMDEIITNLQAQGPWFNRKNGRDHIFVVTADPGRCQFPQPRAREAIYLHHFGMLQRLRTEPCDLYKQWGAHCDFLVKASLNAIAGKPEEGCHKPGQDIIVPPAPYEFTDLEDKTPHFPTPYVNDYLKPFHNDRKVKIYYAGEIDIHAKEPERARNEPWSDAYYSFGARQLAYRMHHAVEGFNLRTTHAHGSYWQDLSSSIFCLAAAGWAWGGRMKVSVTRGCIPIIIQDGIKVEWEEQLPLQDYAIRIPSWLVHKLPEILDHYIESGRAAKMQRVLECVWRLHWWRRPLGRAFELVMCELKRRALGAAPGHIHVDWERCEMKCGDDAPVKINGDEWHNV